MDGVGHACNDKRPASRRGRIYFVGVPTEAAPADVPAPPQTQLPRGRYPATATTIWLVSILVLLIEAALAFGVPGP